VFIFHDCLYNDMGIAGISNSMASLMRAKMMNNFGRPPKESTGFVLCTALKPNLMETPLLILEKS